MAPLYSRNGSATSQDILPKFSPYPTRTEDGKFEIPVAWGNDALKIENAIRNQRSQKGISLRSLANHLGISASQLSKIETGKSKLSVDLALKIAELLEVPAAVFLSKGRPTATGRRTITRSTASDGQTTPGMHFKPLCSEFKDHDILYWIVTLSATTLEENGGWRQHPGQEFFYVLSGQVQLLSQLYEAATLNVGDSILFDSDQPHAYVTVGGPAQVLMINSLA
jgi:transcriptional regulator with XRE-family HTH domain